MSRKSLQRLRLALWGLVLVVGLGASWLLLSPRGQAVLPTDDIGRGDYQLLATDGQTFTAASLRGAPSLVFFGFTHCPDVCPMTLGAIDGWKQELGPLAEDLRVWFVSVDPERDTLDLMRDYVGWLPGTVGVTGTPDELRKAVAAFKIYARKVPVEGGDYAMDHSAYVMLFDAKGAYNQIFSHTEDPDLVVERLRRFLTTQG